jgi:hypothetical protein
MTQAAKGVLRRMRDVELTILGEALAIVFVAVLFVSPIRQLHTSRLRLALIPVAAVLAWSLWSRWNTRNTNRRRLSEWTKQPLRRDGTLVIQENENDERTGIIDTTGRYTVRWERFDSTRALYTVSQGKETVYVSTLAPNAPEILKDALLIANYPCEDWPNLDL